MAQPSRGIDIDGRFTTLSIRDRLTAPSIDTGSGTRSILPPGNMGTTGTTLISGEPLRDLAYSDGMNWIPLASKFDIPSYTPGESIVYLADVANGGDDSNDGLTATTPKFTLPACLELLREFRSDQGVVEIVGPSTIDLSSTPNINITSLEGLYAQIIIRGQRVITTSGTSVGIAQTSGDIRDPRFLWSTITTTGGLTPGALVKQIYRDLTLNRVFAIHSNTATDINVIGGSAGPFGFFFGEGAPDDYEVYTTQAVIINPSTRLMMFSKNLPLYFEDLDFRPSVFGLRLGEGVQGGSMVLHFRGCLYSPPASFAGPLEVSNAFEGCVLETRGGGVPTGYITRSDRITSQIIANSYIDNVTTQPVGAQVRLWGSYFDLVTFLQFLNCRVECVACWFLNATDTATFFTSGATARILQCRWDACVAGIGSLTSSIVQLQDSTIDSCDTFAMCESSSSLRMRRITFNISTGNGIEYSEGSQGAIRDCTMTSAGSAGVFVTGDANISILNTSINSSVSHGIHATRGGEVFTNGVTIGASGGDGVRLESGSELHGGSLGDGIGPSAAAGFHVIYIASGSEAALDSVPTATPTTVGNDYRVGVAGTKTKALVSAGAAADVNDGFSGATPVENCSISTP